MLIKVTILIVLQKSIKFMSNLANYSPYNKSYQFIHLQNSAYHLRNKQKIKPKVNTNLKKHSCTSQITQPYQLFNKSEKCSSSHDGSTRVRCQSARARLSQCNLSVQFKQPHRVIHKNDAFQRIKSARISQENMKLVRKIIQTDCQIVKNSTAQQHFRKHQKYRNLRSRYQQNGERFTTPILNIDKLNPVLINYKNRRILSGRGEVSHQQNISNLQMQWID